MKIEAIYVHGFVLTDAGNGDTLSEYVDMEARQPDGFCAYEIWADGSEWDGGEECDFSTLEAALAWADARAAAYNVSVQVY
jgi:hypothetical protein